MDTSAAYIFLSLRFWKQVFTAAAEKRKGGGGQRKERLIDKLRSQLATGARGEAITALEAKNFKEIRSNF